jgi:hypothetical protein
MPLKRIVKLALAAGVATAGFALPAASSYAAGCPAVTATPVFASFGDTALYDLAPNGTFLNNATGWNFTGNVSVVPDTEPFNLLDFFGAKSIVMGQNSTATSPPFCVSGNDPYFRYLMRPTGVSQMLTQILVEQNGNQWIPLTSYVNQAVLPNSIGIWTPTKPNPLSTLLPLGNDGTATIKLQFVNLIGSYTVGDVWVDPWARR